MIFGRKINSKKIKNDLQKLQRCTKIHKGAQGSCTLVESKDSKDPHAPTSIYILGGGIFVDSAAEPNAISRPLNSEPCTFVDKRVPFCMIQDTREQTPLIFPSSIPIKIKTLYPADYSIEGLEDRFAIERKSLEDLIGSLIGKKKLVDGTIRLNRDRLIEELTVMRSYDFAAVVVTSPRYAIDSHCYTSQIPPDKVIGMICSIEALTGVHFKFFSNAEECARWVALEAIHFYRRVHGLSSLKPKLKLSRLSRRNNNDGQN